MTTSTTGAARTKRSGASISYRKEFETIREFFGGKKKKSEVRKQKPEVSGLKPEEEKSTVGDDKQ